MSSGRLLEEMIMMIDFGELHVREIPNSTVNITIVTIKKYKLTKPYFYDCFHPDLINFRYCVCFRDLRCLRNTIHANLFITYILADSLWIITLSTEVSTTSTSKTSE